MVWEKDINPSPTALKLPRFPGKAYFYTKRDLKRFLEDLVEEDQDFIHCKVLASRENGFFRRSFLLEKRQPLPHNTLLHQLKAIIKDKYVPVFHVRIDRRSQSRGVVIFENNGAALKFEFGGKIRFEIGGMKIIITPGRKPFIPSDRIKVELTDIPETIHSNALVGSLKRALNSIGRIDGFIKFSGNSGIISFFDDENFTPNHKILNDGFVEVCGNRIVVKLKDQFDGSESSYSQSASS